MPSFSYQIRQMPIRTLGCSWRAGVFMLGGLYCPISRWVARHYPGSVLGADWPWLLVYLYSRIS